MPKSPMVELLLALADAMIDGQINQAKLRELREAVVKELED